jgi:hypothetical protein
MTNNPNQQMSIDLKTGKNGPSRSLTFTPNDGAHLSSYTYGGKDAFTVDAEFSLNEENFFEILEICGFSSSNWFDELRAADLPQCSQFADAFMERARKTGGSHVWWSDF